MPTFYNPYQRGPDIGGGFDQILAQLLPILQLRQQKQRYNWEQQQQALENQLAQRRQTMLEPYYQSEVERNRALAGRSEQAPDTRTPEEKDADDLVAAGLYPTKGAALKAIKNIMTPDERAEMEGKIAAARAKCEAPYKAATQEKQWEDPANYYSRTIGTELGQLGDDLMRMKSLSSSTNYDKANDPLARSIMLNETRQKKLRGVLSKITPGKPISAPLEAEIKSVIGMVTPPLAPEGWNPSQTHAGKAAARQQAQAPASALPPEVVDYMKKHPEIPVNQVVAMYAEWKRTKAKK